MANENVLKDKYIYYDKERVKKIVGKYNKYKELAERNQKYCEDFKKANKPKNGKIKVMNREYPEYDKMAGEADEAYEELESELTTTEGRKLLSRMKALKIEDKKLEEEIADAIFLKQG